MKLVNILVSFFLLAVFSDFVYATESSSKTNTKMRMHSLERLLYDYQNFNRKADSFKTGEFALSQDTLEHEARSLDVKYNDLLTIFVEKKSDPNNSNFDKNKNLK